MGWLIFMFVLGHVSDFMERVSEKLINLKPKQKKPRITTAIGNGLD